MKLTLKRFRFDSHYTAGKIWIDERDSRIFTLEDAVRDAKITGQTAIPTGIYKVIVDYSEHFEKELPHILDVPGFTGVRIHPGNTDKDTEGCILVGYTWDGDFIGNSRKAFDSLFAEIKAAPEVILEII